MKIKAFWYLSLVFFCNSLYAGSLCSGKEKAIFSFETMSKKFLSICKERSGKYLAYRFGRSDKIEMQFPNNLDETSWDQFEFSGMYRGDGNQNAGFGDYSLSFNIRKSEYIIFQQWNHEEDTYSIGVTIAGLKKPITIIGLKKTQEGSLVLLDNEGKKLRNVAFKTQ